MDNSEEAIPWLLDSIGHVVTLEQVPEALWEVVKFPVQQKPVEGHIIVLRI